MLDIVDFFSKMGNSVPKNGIFMLASKVKSCAHIAQDT